MRIYLSAGELSGDHLGASLAEALRAEAPEARLEGYGGPAMQAAGVDVLYPLASLAVMGLLPVVRHLPQLWRLLRRTEAYLADARPDVAVLIDYPGWHFVVARAARRLGIPVVQFVAPQLWAWAPWRIRKLRARVDRLLVVLPFEAVYFRDRGIDARFVGHPLVDRLARAAERALPPRPADAPPFLGLLPGSRHQEWSRLLPIFLRAAASLRRDRPELTVRVACAHEEFRPAMEQVARQHGEAGAVEVGQTHAIQRDATLVLTSSGTATLECTYFRTPMVVAYPVGRVAGLVARLVVTAPHIALTNLLAGRELVPEFLFSGDAAPAIAAAARAILDDPARRAAIVAGLDQVRDSLLTRDPSRTAAREILALVGSRRAR
ncbi:MAG: lipid-A-disaccharide synthase [Planctomycetes bacterium]|nr:lipid-A-disaccharide synthase [Planctomycetota bacterium]